MAISDKIQQVMKERNISYAELSRITGIAPSSIQSYGSGRSSFNRCDKVVMKL